MRMLERTWRNGRGGKWDCRIRWYQGMDDNDIRLSMEDTERRINHFPSTLEKAEKIYFMFKQGCPEPGSNQPFVNDMLKLINDM